jgi:hypothetical protein
VKAKWYGWGIVPVATVFLVAGCGTSSGSTSSGSSASSAPSSSVSTGLTSTSGQSSTATQGGGEGKFSGNHGSYAGGMFASLSTVLKIPSKTIFSDLKKGESLAQIAASEHVSNATLTASLEAAYKSQMDKLVSSGKISAAKAKTLIAHYDSQVGAMIVRKGMPAFGHHGNGGYGDHGAGASAGANGSATSTGNASA